MNTPSINEGEDQEQIELNARQEWEIDRVTRGRVGWMRLSLSHGTVQEWKAWDKWGRPGTYNPLTEKIDGLREPTQAELDADTFLASKYVRPEEREDFHKWEDKDNG